MRWISDVFWPRLWRAMQNWQADQADQLAAALAYYALLSLFPLVLILLAAFGYVLRFVPQAQSAQQELLELTAENISPVIAGYLEQIFTQVQTQADVSGPVGLLVLVLTAIGIFSQLETAFDRIWQVPPAPWQGLWGAVGNALIYRFRAFLILLGVVLGMVAAFFGSMALAAVRTFTTSLWGGQLLWNALETAVGLLASWALFAVMYKTIPRAQVSWSAASEGAAVAAVLWELLRRFLAAFLISPQYSAYGVVGAVLALLVWMQLTGCILLLGAEYARSVQKMIEQTASSGSH
ncbi:MAG: YihY/virulence factor BrkB family protein [Thermoguttaceae bacterium]|nr:YihY/virulence factor BrkB family protein [Thermoguttaceae bacterium]MDW8037569.1 YihY/virulence factor BrkB family protein [Thermoguttaceae bacterium]